MSVINVPLEKVLVVPANVLFSSSHFQGLKCQDINDYFKMISNNLLFIPRDQAEKDETYKQVIPYMIIMQKKKVLLIERFSSQGEKRLHNKLSIGIGGHINPEDVVNEKLSQKKSSHKKISWKKLPWEHGLERELHEELEFHADYSVKFIGLLNDDNTPVGRVHLGLVYLIEFQDGEVNIREKDKMEGTFVPVSHLCKVYSRLESWSQIVCDGGLKGEQLVNGIS